MPTLPDRRVALSLLAHPDDAEILCAGTLVRLADAGWQIHIAAVAAGDCGTTMHSRAAIAGKRWQEGVDGAAKIGATYHCLGEPDLQVVFDKPTNRKAIDLLRRVAPTLLFTHARHDYMLDHEQTHLLARGAAFGYSAPNASELPLIEGSAIPWLYYCDPVEGRDPYTGERVRPTTLIDVTSQMERKAEMLACHASQREWLRAHHGMDEYLDAMRRFGAERGGEIGVEFAEAFVQHRGHPYPQTDLLNELFGSQVPLPPREGPREG
jgi:LmbE family N-acetylglucosaminyl deacetylase